MEDKTVNRKKTYGMVLLTVIVLLTSMLLSSCALFPDEEEELVPPLVTTRKTEYLTKEVTRTTLELVVRGVASVVAPQSTDVYFENFSGVLSKVWVKKGDYVNAGDVICELDNSGLAEQLEEQEMRARIAELEFAEAEKKWNAGQLSELEWEKAKLAIYLSRRNINSLREQYAATRLIAPVSGQITYLADLAIGSTLAKNKVVCTISDTSKLYIRFADGSYAEIPLGAECTYTHVAGDSQTVYRAIAIETPDSVSPDTATKLQLTSVLLEPLDDTTLKLGETLSLSYVKARSENCIAVPISALKRDGSRTYVYVLVDGYKQERDVRVGIRTATSYEILEGLSEGELFIY